MNTDEGRLTKWNFMLKKRFGAIPLWAFENSLVSRNPEPRMLETSRTAPSTCSVSESAHNRRSSVFIGGLFLAQLVTSIGNLRDQDLGAVAVQPENLAHQIADTF